MQNKGKLTIMKYFRACVGSFLVYMKSKKEETSCKNYKPGREGLRDEVVGNKTYLAPLGYFLMHAKLLSGTPINEKIVLSK